MPRTVETLSIEYIRILSQTSKVSIVINESVEEIQTAINDLFKAKNVTIYNIFSEENLYDPFYKFLPKKLTKYLRYCYYTKQIAIKADFIFVRYYNLLVRLLRAQIFDVVILENASSLKAVSVIRQFDKKVTVIYDASSGKKRLHSSFKDINAVIAAGDDDFNVFKKKNNGGMKGIAIEGIDKKNVARKIGDFIQAQPGNIKKWKMKIHFLTFASTNYKNTFRRITTEAENCGFFDTITCLNEFDLPIQYRIDNQVNEQTRGYGYWIWKSYITNQLLSEIPEGDILVYIDAGCSINCEGRKRFYDYIKLLTTSEYSNLSFQLNFPEKIYTKGDLFKHFHLEENNAIRNSGQLMATSFLIRKDKSSVNLTEKWFTLCHEHKNLLIDSPSSYPNDPKFIAHRYDQSIFSILRKLQGSIILGHETFFENWNENRHFPIHERRWKS
ncbi:MAG: hypothetical protein ACTHK8_21475 [Ginsengibacter sp.]